MGCERCLNLGFVNSVDYAIPFVLGCLRLGQFVCLICGSVQITGLLFDVGFGLLFAFWVVVDLCYGCFCLQAVMLIGLLSMIG